MHRETLTPGTVVAGKYVVERPLGQGGMGAVYVVSHANTGKRLAMKTLLAEFVNNADLVGRFLREAQVMGRLQHRHVVDVFDVGRDGDVLYIVMELLEGKPLSDLLHDSSLTLEEALVIMLRAMEGVSAAHAQGIVHRDLKPDNIFICVGTSGRLDDPRVLDFGISKLEDSTADQLTRSGVSMGTPYYMSIEQLKGQRDLDQRVDVYALGVILYEAIAGETPFMADSISALAIKVLTTEPVHLAKLRPDLPSGLAGVVMKALARERDDRYRSVRQLIEALRPFVQKSVGLPVPEGQGRLLRTPRSAAAARPSSGSSRPPVHARGTQGELDASTTQGDEYSARPRASGKKRVAWALAILVLAGGLAVLSHRLRLDKLGSAAGDPTVSAGSATEHASPVETARRGTLDPTTGAPQTPTHVAPANAAAQPASAAAENAQPASAVGANSQPTGSSLLGGVIRKGADTQSATPAAAQPANSTRRRAHRGMRETGAPAAQPKASVPTAAAQSSAPTPLVPPTPATTPTAATPPAPQRKSAEGRAGKLGSDEF